LHHHPIYRKNQKVKNFLVDGISKPDMFILMDEYFVKE
jgi:hypothetical protein